ncbi:alpha/beta hydrolase [Cohnella thailandensis]|uniref:Alpha/beta hydrolase n=1 Tax=Cohnella thailandensis TaxID=557557 RepID=A0A841T4S9_9BACL|nr:alpha/beta hydrolase [Cohnella thailandensis]MBB6636857.1 alpha/beta hydrolase [Cohnella thailandensis]MBP1973263.1 acetyl esterase/lipase [Cohnella thailandensis]
MKDSLRKAHRLFKDHLPGHGATIEELRVGVEAMFALLPTPSDVITEKVDIDGMEGEWQISPESKEDRVLLYLHGGGFMYGSIDSYRIESSELGRAAKARVLSINYRLAPEHPFPAPIEDALKAYDWLLNQGYQPQNIIIGGGSAGGNLTAALLMNIRDTKTPMAAGGVMISPWIDLGQTGDTYTTKEGVDPVNTKEALVQLADNYLNGVSPNVPYASPIYGDLRGLPPIYVMVGESELMLRESLTFVTQAALAGVDIRFRSWPSMFHNWLSFYSSLEEAKEGIISAGNFMNELYEKHEKKGGYHVSESF